jgi:hypothetical protein
MLRWRRKDSRQAMMPAGVLLILEIRNYENLCKIDCQERVDVVY